MKEGWKKYTIEDIIDFLRTGLNPRVHFKLNTSDAEGYYITVRELKGFNFQVDTKTDRINQQAILRINERSRLQIGDVLYSGTGTIGRTAIVNEEPTWWNIKEGVYALTPKKDLVNSKYLVYALKSEPIHKKILSKASGTAVMSIPMKELAKIEIPIPSLQEQQRIVEKLDNAFAKIDALKTNAEKNLQNKKDFFNSILQKELSAKQGWSIVRIGDISTITHGKNQKAVECENGKYPIIGSGGSVMGYASDYLCEEGTTILGRKGSINNPLYVETKFWNVDTAFGIVANKDCDKRFLYYIIKREDWSKRNTGTTLPSLTQTVVSNVDVAIPSLDEQRKISEKLDNISSLLSDAEHKFKQVITECDALKQSFLRKAFKGEL